MNATLFIDGEKHDIEQFISSIVKQTLESIKIFERTSQDQDFDIHPERLYSLKNPDLINYFGLQKLKRPEQKIAFELRKNGIDPIYIGKKAGLMATGSQILEYMNSIKIPTYLAP